MTYKDLLNKLNQLTDEQLEMNVISVDSYDYYNEIDNLSTDELNIEMSDGLISSSQHPVLS